MSSLMLKICFDSKKNPRNSKKEFLQVGISSPNTILTTEDDEAS